MKKFIIPIFAVILHSLNSCNTSTSEESIEIQEEENSTTNTNTSNEVSPISLELECFGEVTVPQNSIFEYYSKSNGYVSHLNLMVGDHVKTNELLVQIESPDFVMLQQKLQEAQSNYDWNLKTKERNENLFDAQSISLKDLEESIKEFDIAKSRLINEKEYISEIGFQPNDFINSNLSKLKIKSKSNGTITNISIKNGSKVTPDTHLFTIQDDASKIIEINIPASTYEKIDDHSKFYYLQNKDTMELHIISKSNFIDKNNNVKVFANPISVENQLLIGQKLLIKIALSNK